MFQETEHHSDPHTHVLSISFFQPHLSTHTSVYVSPSCTPPIHTLISPASPPLLPPHSSLSGQIRILPLLFRHFNSQPAGDISLPVCPRIQQLAHNTEPAVCRVHTHLHIVQIHTQRRHGFLSLPILSSLSSR